MKILLEGAINARDLGGMKTAFGTVQHNRLVRSGELSRLTENDVKKLQSLPLERVLDLRTETEMANAPDVKITNVSYCHVPIISATTFGITYEKSSGDEIALMLQAGINRMKARGEACTLHLEIMYRKFVNDPFSRNGYGTFLKTLANNPTQGATLWHCTVGKDRVGTCTALLLYCLGASKQQIYDDYLVTNEQTQAHKEMILDKVRSFVSAEDLALIDIMRSVSSTYLDAFFQEIANKFQTVENFLAECGVTNDNIQNLRKNYLA